MSSAVPVGRFRNSSNYKTLPGHQPDTLEQFDERVRGIFASALRRASRSDDTRAPFGRTLYRISCKVFLRCNRLTRNGGWKSLTCLRRVTEGGEIFTQSANYSLPLRAEFTPRVHHARRGPSSALAEGLLARGEGRGRSLDAERDGDLFARLSRRPQPQSWFPLEPE